MVDKIKTPTNSEFYIFNNFLQKQYQIICSINLVLKNNLRIVKVLLIAPEFSDDFVTDCEMDTEMNIYLVTASTLSSILEAFKTSKYTVFPHVLRDIVINKERIIKALSK